MGEVMNYTIHGEYPNYTLTDEGGYVDSFSAMGQIMERFTWTLEPGDTVTWNAEPWQDDSSHTATVCGNLVS